VDYDSSFPDDFFMTKIDPSFQVLRITIDSIEYLDPATGQPLEQLIPCQSVMIRVTATNSGPATDVVVSLNIDDVNHNNGIIYDSHQTTPSQDIVQEFGLGQQTFGWTWQVPCDDPPFGQYYITVGFHDQHYVLGFEYSGWQESFSVIADGVTSEYWTSLEWEGVTYNLSILRGSADPRVEGVPLKDWNGTVYDIRIEPSDGLTGFEKYEIALIAENALVMGSNEFRSRLADFWNYTEEGKDPETRTTDNAGYCSVEGEEFEHMKAKIAEALRMSPIYYDGWLGTGGIDNASERMWKYREILIELALQTDTVFNNPVTAQLKALSHYLKIAEEFLSVGDVVDYRDKLW
jgi:hypothetical protein